MSLPEKDPPHRPDCRFGGAKDAYPNCVCGLGITRSYALTQIASLKAEIAHWRRLLRREKGAKK